MMNHRPNPITACDSQGFWRLPNVIFPPQQSHICQRQALNACVTSCEGSFGGCLCLFSIASCSFNVFPDHRGHWSCLFSIACSLLAQQYTHGANLPSGLDRLESVYGRNLSFPPFPFVTSLALLVQSCLFSLSTSPFHSVPRLPVDCCLFSTEQA